MLVLFKRHSYINLSLINKNHVIFIVAHYGHSEPRMNRKSSIPFVPSA